MLSIQRCLGQISGSSSLGRGCWPREEIHDPHSVEPRLIEEILPSLGRECIDEAAWLQHQGATAYLHVTRIVLSIVLDVCFVVLLISKRSNGDLTDGPCSLVRFAGQLHDEGRQCCLGKAIA